MDAQEALKKYWPYALGAVVGLFLIMRYAGGNSGSGDGGLAAFYQAQAAAGAQASQNAIAQAQLQAQNEAQARADALARDTLQAQTQVAYLSAQANMAKAVGESAAGVTGALYQPIIAALNSSAYENAAVYQAAAGVAVGGFQSQAAMIDSVASTTQAAADALQVWGPVSQSMALRSAAMTGSLGGLASQAISTFGQRPSNNYLAP